jgi:pyroglutamyl-peptidase
MSKLRILITAFEPYDVWKSNSSWLALVELTKELPERPKVVTRRYPVDFSTVRERLAEDLKLGFDYALHLGQAPGSTRIQFEAIAINVGGSSQQHPDTYRPLVEDGPVAYRSNLPLAAWAERLRELGIPAQVSYHAGTYLCNATMYYSCYLAERMSLPTQSVFIHLPLDYSQTCEKPHNHPALPTALAAAGIREILLRLC